MDYEEKYKSALKWMQSLYGGLHGATKEEAEKYFPELKETKDERIRKTLIEFFGKGAEHNCTTNGISDKDILTWLKKQSEPEDKGEISDGYHTFNELYRYRMLYNAAFFNLLPKHMVHKSKKHHDGKECFDGGWFIVMANLPTGQISNHYELKDWDLFQIPEKEIADEWDGHTPQEAAERLHKYLLEKQGEQTHAEIGQSEVTKTSDQELEPKFKVGDWISGYYTNYKVTAINSIGYVVEDTDGNKINILFKNEKFHHLWTIQDAKDGDLIYVSTEVKGIQAIFHKFENGIIYFHCNLCGDFTQGGYEPSGDVEFVNPLPKTHYQRFFQKMKEACYEWDAKNKTLWQTK